MAKGKRVSKILEKAVPAGQWAFTFDRSAWDYTTVIRTAGVDDVYGTVMIFILHIGLIIGAKQSASSLKTTSGNLGAEVL